YAVCSCSDAAGSHLYVVAFLARSVILSLTAVCSVSLLGLRLWRPSHEQLTCCWSFARRWPLQPPPPP
ncbi:unnamed protein product, partial [Ectocarpus sp. 4 AP-2014]